MRDRHHEACSKPVMLLPASDAICVIRNMHDKSRNLPDPDTSTFDMESDLLNAARNSYEFLGDQCRLWVDTIMTKTQKGYNAVIEQFDHLVQNVLKPQWDAFWEAASKKLDEVTTKDVEQEQSAAPALQSSTKSTKNNSVAQDQNHKKPRKAAMEKDEAAGTRDEEL